ncbi:MAG: cbb3-type cytochrome c oxidase subunit 3 [Gammaproteobacteria bacterium]|nr:MAG: cbb3-type cytochrome c oxidase subunit 3 [Gammaproteobacteria bacterium]RTZ74065.1 MAG: cbb3-type cytochrome c oxidase subunit 3 [Gammaproteobacteria bacterium]RTZ81878.1 MAG: cbb3-type cytochrome c oxidase subunit 3 [Gammaproteobacteria bacterium]
MSSLREYFHTDWSAMTLHDWLGLIITVGAFLAMVWIYSYVFNPKNKERLESQRHIPFEEENTDSEKEK